MPDTGAVVSITQPIEIEIIEDRVHFTCISGGKRTTYAIGFHQARRACLTTINLLDANDRAAVAKVADFHAVKRKPRKGV